VVGWLGGWMAGWLGGWVAGWLDGWVMGRQQQRTCDCDERGGCGQVGIDGGRDQVERQHSDGRDAATEGMGHQDEGEAPQGQNEAGEPHQRGRPAQRRKFDEDSADVKSGDETQNPGSPSPHVDWKEGSQLHTASIPRSEAEFNRRKDAKTDSSRSGNGPTSVRMSKCGRRASAPDTSSICR